MSFSTRTDYPDVSNQLEQTNHRHIRRVSLNVEKVAHPLTEALALTNANWDGATIHRSRIVVPLVSCPSIILIKVLRVIHIRGA